MSHQVFSIPNYRDTAVDLVLCNPKDPNANGVLHYAYTVGADADAISKRTLPWAKLQDFKGDYGKKHVATIERLSTLRGYYPGESVLSSPDSVTGLATHDTIMRLGALELLANLSSGRLSTTDKDPFPHQLALQQFVRKTPQLQGFRRILIADEVGLGKTIEVGLILRDILLARGRLEGFRCLYLTSGGLVEDAADKLRDVLSGTIDDTHLVDTVRSFRMYGTGNTLGVHVASMHAARLYATPRQKALLPRGTAPQIVIIDECHHAASEGELAGAEVRSQVATHTYVTAKQLLCGEFWEESKPPELAILMSATPFRSLPQFVNLLRLLTHNITCPCGTKLFDAYDATAEVKELSRMVQDPKTAASIVWRRQSDDSVRSWSGNRIFPNLRVIRPHQVSADDPSTPLLAKPSDAFLSLLAEVKASVSAIARAHGQSFGGFAISQLEKKLTSSSIAGACWLFSWAVRHAHWETQEEFKNDKRVGTEGLRRLIRRISQRIAQYKSQATSIHETVRFPSDGFEFTARSLSQAAGDVVEIQKYSKTLREDKEDNSKWIATQAEIEHLVNLGEALLDLRRGPNDEVGPEDAKLKWLNELLERYPEDRFLLFTESLQTCEALQSALGTTCRTLIGSMGKAARNAAVADLCNPRMNARVLVATSAADEGFDLQVANKVIHWDLSSSPATLMQRNGRVARLGQISDVSAYYLILTGTHEERRDTALQVKFAELGIDDDALKSRILGSLSEDEEARLEQAIEENDQGIVGEILKRAKDDNDDMDEQLAALRTEVQYSQVLSREDLAGRLSNWRLLGVPDAAADGISFNFDTIPWIRPVFGEVAAHESVESSIASFSKGDYILKLVFDPEFLLFGPTLPGSRPGLAGLAPWVQSITRHGKHCIRPFSSTDLVGSLLQGLARLQRADYFSIPRRALGGGSVPPKACWLLFCTHPLREVETGSSSRSRPYLTYYAFPEINDGDVPAPLDPAGADADAVHSFLVDAENYALAKECSSIEDAVSTELEKKVGSLLKEWLEEVTQFGASSFLEEAKYFVPIPVALVRIT